MESVMDKMEKKFGAVGFNFNKYVLIQDAHLDGTGDDAAYFADAIKVGDLPDSNGCIQVYSVEWKIIDQETEDESLACDWEKPVDVDATGLRFDIKDGSVF